MPCRWFGANGFQFEGWMYLLAAMQNTTIASSLMPTITLFALADSRMPTTRTTVSTITTKKPMMLKCMAQPVSGEYAGVLRTAGM